MTTSGIPPDNPDPRPVLRFAVVALPVGWLVLTPPVALGLPAEPFVLAVLLLGLVLPALVLTRAEGGGGVRRLLRDTVRRPRSWWILVPAVALIPALTWAGATLVGADRTIDADLLATMAVNVASSVLVVNLWEELAWTGFVQRRAIAHRGAVAGSLLTAGLFAGVHLPLAFAGGHPAAGIAALAVSGVGLRLLIAVADRWSGRSLLVVALVHASFNVAAEVVEPDHDRIRYAVTLALGLLALPALRSVRTGTRNPVREEVMS